MMNEIDTQRHIRSMRLEFPESPCAICTGEITKICSYYKTCERYRVWFGGVWRDLRRFCGVTEESRKEWEKKGRMKND